MKAPRNLQRFSCTLEIAVKQESDDAGENVIRLKTDSGQDLLSLSIAPELGQHIAAAYTGTNVFIGIDGNVSVVFDNEFQLRDRAAFVSLDQLVASAVSPDMLEDEPDAAAMLVELHGRLLKSLEYVDEAIASLVKD